MRAAANASLVPEPLLAAIREQRAVLFVGAGASRDAKSAAGTKCPTTEELRASLAQRFLGSDMAGYDLMSVAEMAIQANGSAVVFEHIRDLMKDQEPTPAHLLIPTFRWRMIAGTNYDLLIERAYSRVTDRLQSLVPFVKDSEPIIERLQAAMNPVQYIKLHGSIDDIHDANAPPILSHEHYDRYSLHRKRLFGRVYDVAHESPVIFCGYSLSDPHIRSLLYKLGPGTRPAFYLVAPKPNKVENQFWASKNVTVVDATFAKFMSALDAAIPPLMRAPAVRPETVERPIRRHFKTDAQESDRLSYALSNDLLLVRADLPTADQKPQQFYQGFDTGWGCIQQRLDVSRKVTDDLLFDAVLEEKTTSEPRLFVLKGPGGSGKTVALKRAAWEAANSLDQLVLWKKESGALDTQALQELFDLTGKRIYLFVDRIALHANAVADVLQVARAKQVPITVVGAERQNEWLTYCDVLDVRYDPTILALGRLSQGEVEQLLDLLARHNSLGLLEGKTREQQLKSFLDHADRQLLVALHEATRGKPFEEIIAEEYQGLVPEEARRLYLDICTLNQFAVPVRAGTISRISSINFASYQSEFFEPLENLVFSSRDNYTGDYQYRARHSAVARLVFQAACPTDEDKAEQLARLISGLDIGYSTDRTALSKMMRGRRLAETMHRAQTGRELYKNAVEAAPGEAFLYQQWAIFESMHDGGSLTYAEDAARTAREMDPRSPAIIHTQAEIARKIALRADSQIVKDQYRKQARERLSEIKPAHSKIVFSSRCKLLVDEISELVRDIDDNTRQQELTSFGEKVREAEALLARSIQEYPDDAELLAVEASFRQSLSETDKAVRALERALLAGPRGSGVAIRLARIHLGKGNEARALEVLSKALEKNPEDKHAHFEMAQALMAQEKPDMKDVGGHLVRSYSQGDNNFEARHLYAQWLVLTGSALEGARLFEEIDRTAPRDYRTRMPKKLSAVAAHMGAYQGRVAKKTATFAFIRSAAYVNDIYAPEAGTKEWDGFEVGTDVAFRISFTRSGPVALAIVPR